MIVVLNLWKAAKNLLLRISEYVEEVNSIFYYLLWEDGSYIAVFFLRVLQSHDAVGEL